MVEMKKQSGAVLMISLLVLLVITLLGVSSTHGTRTQERMAKNSQDRQIAFQTAETTASWTEQKVFDDIGGDIFNIDLTEWCDLFVEDLSTLSTDCKDSGGNAKPWDSSYKVWESGVVKNQALTSAQKTSLFGTNSAIAKDPRQQVVLLNLEKRKGFESSSAPGGLVATFVVTSLGYGEEENTTVKIQTLFNVDVGL
ncbi:MAG: PilX N-terminal domain-containing pilus assembly protein [Gammaproteobacteria bacterium]|nr:PilX N-terminal domain-containing pilus assembly protein [Gammaproteobacteria bacterium]